MTAHPPWRSATTLLAWLGLLAAGMLVILRMQVSTDLSAFLPAAPDARQRVLIEQLRSGMSARTFMLGIEGGQPAQRAAASRAVAAALRQDKRFEQVHNGEQSAWADVGAWVVQHRYLLSPAVDAQRFTPAGLRDAIDDTLSLLGTPAGRLVKPLLERDPTGETQEIAAASLPGSGPRTLDGVWVSRDGQRAMLVAVTAAAGADLDAQAAAMAQIRTAFAPQGAQGLVLQLSGAPKFSVDSRAQIESEVQRLAIAGTVLMGALLLLAFGSPAALGAAALPVASGVVAGIAAVSLVFGTVHGVTLGFGSTLIGEAVDYGIYYLIQAHATGLGAAGWRAWLRESWPTVRLGLLTSVCGFAALALSGFPGLSQLGVFSIAGLVAAALTTRFVLPVLVPHGARGTGARQRLASIASAIVRAMPRVRRVVAALGLASLALLVWKHDRLWAADLSSLSPVPARALALDASLRADLGDRDGGAVVVVQAADVQAVLQAAESVGARLDALVDRGLIGGYRSPTRLLPSVATQQQRLAALPQADDLAAALAQATAGGPLAPGRLAPFLADVAAARGTAPLTLQSIRGTPAAPLVGNLLLRRADGSWAALLTLDPTPTGTLDLAAVQQAAAGQPGAQVLDVPVELRRLYRHYLQEAQVQALVGAVAVVLLIAWRLRSLPRLLAVCLPLALAVVLTMAGLYLLQVPLGILHLVGLLLVVAVGSNYALFFDLAQAEGPPRDDMLASLLLANLTTVLSFGLIALSGIPALSAIGRVVAPGALLALLLSAAFARHRGARSGAPAAADAV
ncbi:MAG: MMPL family transporter [Rubrivivax sp.]|nr:MMPL family transporter [Rubrivivax sp.]